MSTFGQAALHARRGATIKLGEKTIRLLTQEEANAYALANNPSRRTVMETIKDKDGNESRQPLVKNGKIVTEEHGEGRPHALGLFEVSGESLLPYSPSEDDLYVIDRNEAGEEVSRSARTDWEVVQDVAPEAVSPEAVDEVLAEQ